jgi:hypothetical protein
MNRIGANDKKDNKTAAAAAVILLIMRIIIKRLINIKTMLIIMLTA